MFEAKPDATESLRLRQLDAVRSGLREHVDRLAWSAERLEQERRDRLRELVKTAIEKSPWHRARLRGVDPTTFEAPDLATLPTMTKSDLVRHFDRIVTDERLTAARVKAHIDGLVSRPEYLFDNYVVVVSSGSSGAECSVPYAWDAWVSCYLGAIRSLTRQLGGAPVSAAVIAAGSPEHTSRALFQTFSDPATLALHPFPATAPLDEIIAGLNAVQPDVLMAYPSALAEIVQQASSGPLRIKPRIVITASEPLLPNTRIAVERAFGVSIQNWWFSSEAGPMAIGCGQGSSLHLSEDLLIVEPVDEHNQPAPVGAPSAKVLVTNLYNHALPLIRYEITDEVTLLAEPCRCGSAHRLIADPHGRMSDTFIYGEIRIHPSVFRAVLEAHPTIYQYQVRQTANGADLVVQGTADTERIAHEVAESLASHGLASPDVSVVCAGNIARLQTGRIQRFIPLTSRADDPK
ncbi:MAG TPA: hypothetical protein VHY34_07265 [Caulobacteraceae bacterium]|nr:hypothetical protein [Caulobacteraceae bacterium]